MRRLWRFIWWTALVIGLLIAVALFTLRWWVTSAVNAALPPLLAQAPLERSEIAVQELGLAETRVHIDELSMPGLRITDTDVDVDYTVEQLRRQQLNSIWIRHPHLLVDLGQWLDQPTDSEAESSGFAIPAEKPLRQVVVENAEIELLKGNWRQQLTAFADINFDSRTRLRLQIDDGVAPLSLTAVGHRGGKRAVLRASWGLDSVTHWLAAAPEFGVSLPELAQDIELSGGLDFDAALARDEVLNVKASLRAADYSASVAGGSLAGDSLEASLFGHLPDQLQARLALTPATLTWSNGAGRIEGLRGELNPVSLTPLGVFKPQTLSFDQFSQGELSASDGRLTFTYTPEEKAVLDVNLQANALDGSIVISLEGSPFAPRSLTVRIQFDRVDLEQLAALAPDFEGRIIGSVSGELGVRIGKDILGLLHGRLDMTPGTTGRFQFYKQGWITQDASLNPVDFVQGKDLLTILQEPNGATVLTELAMRDLHMTKFSLVVSETQPKKPADVFIQIEGEGTVKGTQVPVVLDVPISGDVIETLNLILKLQQKMQ
ncbi:YdbH domain-containing protein [Cerasicoccus frondis]|uniref:YdbH domain-containing protein n=1 Tax=Cerasicoccus frondis TaxID=490090 RepID=UPI0028525973|nr:YdbH domain-containing protein [Cerasicoccus frondis]